MSTLLAPSRQMVSKLGIVLLTAILALGIIFGASCKAELLQDRPRIQEGLWVLAFLEEKACAHCDATLSWLEHVASAFPEFKYVVSYASPLSIDPPVGGREHFFVFEDTRAQFGTELGVEEAPSVLVFVSGRLMGQLEPPFTEGELLRVVAVASILALNLPTSAQLKGVEAPPFVGIGSTAERALKDFDLPLLLVFFSPACSSCWEALGDLGRVLPETQILLVAIADSRGLSIKDEATVSSLADQYDSVSWLSLQDPAIVSAYMISRSPTYVVIDEAGLIAGIHEGKATPENLRTLVTTSRDERIPGKGG